MTQPNDANEQDEVAACENMRAGLPVGDVRERQERGRDARDKCLSRREVLRGTLRGLAVAALAAVTGWLGWRSLAGGRSAGSASSHTCSGDWICKSCPRLDGCVLPQAMSTRRAAEGRP